jgi:hypothetical protein
MPRTRGSLRADVFLIADGMPNVQTLGRLRKLYPCAARPGFASLETVLGGTAGRAWWTLCRRARSILWGNPPFGTALCALSYSAFAAPYAPCYNVG